MRRPGALLLLALLALALAGCGEDGAGGKSVDAARPAAPAPLFSPRSVWNRRVDGSAPVDPDSATMVEALGREVAAEEAAEVGPWISTGSYSVPVYTVGRKQPKTRVRLVSPYREPALQAAFRAVPLPEGARPAAGSDAHLVVWQPATGRLWEFWQLRREGSGWAASWGGAIRDALTDPGVYGARAWPGADPSWGASASALSIAGGLIRLGDLEAGRIDHALALSVPEPRAGVYAAPARRTDGTSADPLSLPEGAHLRLDPELDLAELSMPPLTRMLARAAQRYGIVVRDRSGEVTFYGEDPRAASPDPYRRPGGFFAGRYPSELLAAFPWEHLQVLEMKLRRGP
jgi:hypothetical protein